jgi:hypothetical protein
MRIIIGKLMVFIGVVGVLFSMLILTPFTPSSKHESRLAELGSVDETEWKKEYPDADQLKVLDEMNQSIEITKRAERTSDISLIASILVFVGGIATWRLIPIQSERDNG